jgi:type I restriction enzyme M protein
MTDASQLVKKLKDYRNVLRHDGMSHTAYVEQLTFLLFLKMDQEQRELAAQGLSDFQSQIPDEYSWASLVRLDGVEQETHYREILRTLGQGTGLIPTIFRKAQNDIQDPAKLNRLVHLIGEETWSGMAVDLKGQVYEELLEDFGQDVKSGAGQYFTPRPLIKAIVDVMRPTPEHTIHDPAAGTGGFLLAAFEFIRNEYPDLNRDQLNWLRNEALSGGEIETKTARMCVMNLYLHGIGLDLEDSPIAVGDSIASDPGIRVDMVLTNPPFGKKTGMPMGGNGSDSDNQEVVREDFWATTSNKQLNFVQHIGQILKIGGSAAVVVPDNVLFEGGAGETIRRKLLDQFDVHTLLRLPTGIFYKPGVKANVLFFDKKPGGPDANTRELWIYDLRTNVHFTLKQNPLQHSDFDDFVACYNPSNRRDRQPTWSEHDPDGRWRVFTIDELMARDKVSLDIFWLRDESLEESANLPSPDVLAAEIFEDLEAALEQFAEIAKDLSDS